MRESRYRDFSLKTHKINQSMQRPNTCQFELTFGCGLHCKYCYTDCYNRPDYLKKELDTNQIKSALDKVYQAGAFWLCFTGGDPLTRPDFMDIYSYAREKGFIITLFTNAYSMNKEIAGYLKQRPPFVIEITLNALSQGLYEKISQVKGSFKKTMAGLKLILKQGLPLKIKTQIMKDNLKELPRIKKFISSLGLEFRPDFTLHARLNGDSAPCDLRISPRQARELNGSGRVGSSCPGALPAKANSRGDFLFHCAAGGDDIHIDPCGNIFLCNLVRNPSFNIFKTDIAQALNKLYLLARESKFSADSECNNCSLRQFCDWCPGKAYLEAGDMQAPIEYYCELTKTMVGDNG